MEVLKALQDAKATVDQLGPQLADAVQAVADEKKASYDQGRADEKAEEAGMDPGALKYSQNDVDGLVAQAKIDGGKEKVAEMQPQIDDLKLQVAALKADDDAKTAIIASIDGLLHPAPAPVPQPAQLKK
jgi:hypothetical protein